MYSSKSLTGCNNCSVISLHRNRQCHIYPFNKSEPSTGHAATRTHAELKKQALEVCANKEAGKKVYPALLYTSTL